MVDITSSLNITRRNVTVPGQDGGIWVYSLPGGHYLQVDSATPLLNFSSVAPPVLPSNSTTSTGARPQPVALNFTDSVAFPRGRAAIADVFFIYKNYTHAQSKTPARDEQTVTGPDMRTIYTALEFVLEWCVQTYQTTVINGKPSTVRLEHAANFNYNGDDAVSLRLVPSSESGSSGDTPRNAIYSVDLPTHYSLQRHFQQLLSGTVLQISASGQTVLLASSEPAQALWQPFDHIGQRSADSPWDLFNTNQTGLGILLDNVATSMTNAMRAAEGLDTWTGNVQVQRIVIEVRWGYAVVPIVFACLCLVFLTATLFYQRHTGTRGKARVGRGLPSTRLWKGSSLAVLSALGPEESKMLGGLKDLSTMKTRANTVRLKLESAGDDGWRLIDRHGFGNAAQNVRPDESS
jgi:hypothetical protein